MNSLKRRPSLPGESDRKCKAYIKTMINNKFGKFFGPSASYAGIVLVAAGVFSLTISISIVSVILILAGSFTAFTYTGTLIDTDNKRVKPYTSFFGIGRSGKWINTDQFTRFSIKKVTGKYTAYSRTNMRLDMKVSDVELRLLNKNGSKKAVLNKFGNFENAKKEMERLNSLLLIDSQFSSSDKMQIER